MSLEKIIDSLKKYNIKKKINLRIVSLGFLGAVLLNGCMNIKEPIFQINHGRYIRNPYKIKNPSRLGIRPVPSILTKYLDLENLGKHHYLPHISEKNGLVYTEKAGFIDICHLRWCADVTAYLSAKFYENLEQGKQEFSFKLEEPSIYHIKINYPENWKNLDESEKRNIMYQNSIEFGKYMSYTSSTWHEILTWYGYKSWGIFYEFPSAFSWEDTVSNLLGVHIGAKALKDENLDYQESVTFNLEQELRKLKVQSKEQAKKKLSDLKDWYNISLLTLSNIKKRNFDIGLDDGYITPIIYQGVKAEPLKDYPVPNIYYLEERGLEVEVIIEPKEWEKSKILDIIGKEKYIKPAEDFPKIMKEIKKGAIRIYGQDVDKP
jgi:hypothetical protein